MRYRLLAAAVLFAGVVACGPSAADLAAEEAARVEAEARAAEEEAARQSALLQSQFAEAEEFVRSRTQPLSRTEDGTRGAMRHDWRAEFSSFDSPMRWREVESMAAANGSIAAGYTDTLDFTADPAELSLPVTVEAFEGTGWYAVKFECRTGSCITVTGTREVAAMDAYQTETDAQAISEQRTSNSWLYSDLDTAQRVARAAETMLQQNGAQNRVY